MKIVAIADTHTKHDKCSVPDGDVLVHAGDLTYTGRTSEFEDALAWLESLPQPHKLIIAGNHDFGAREFFRHAYMRDDRLEKAGIHFLHEWGCIINGVHFWGSPYTPTFGRWAYLADRGDEIRKHWDLIPTKTDVLITHGPPWGILDLPSPTHSFHLGCEELHDVVFERVRPKVHIFGHIHGGYGRRFKTDYCDVAEIDFYNASVVNEAYEVVNAPWEINL